MKNTFKIIFHSVITIVIIASGIAGFKVLSSSRPALARQQVEVSLPMVRTIGTLAGDVKMTLTGQGTVHPVSEIQLIPEVGGRITDVSPSLINGGTFKAGERLLKIESTDYEIAVTLAEAGVKEAQSQYELARQGAEAAKGEWRQLHPGTEPPSLVAKKPQLEAAKASLDAQKGALERARLDLKRTEIVAPFDGRVRAESVDPGQFVVPGQPLATLYCTDAAEIVVPMDDSVLNWFAVPGFTCDGDADTPVTVSADVAGRKCTWQGHVARAEGQIDEKTRMINVVVRVESPYATRPPLAIGQFVEVRIEGFTLPDATIIPRAAMHGKDTVWAVSPEDNRLYFRTVDIARMDQRGVVIRSGLEPGDQVVVSPLKAVTDGMRVRTVDADEEGWTS